MKKNLALLISSLFTCISTLVFAGSADTLLGNWTTEGGKTQVEIYPCGVYLCGKIVSLKEPNYPNDDPQNMAGRAKVDRNNPDKKHRLRPLKGLNILQDFAYDQEEGMWHGGTIYDPENGKTYKCQMTLKDPNTLQVRGYIGFALIGRTTTWTR